MSARRAGWIAATMWMAGLTAFVLAVVLADLNPPISTVQESESAVEGALWLSTWVGFGLVGAIVVSRQPGNRIGWILSGVTLGVGVAVWASAYARFALVTEAGGWPFGAAAAWIATWAFFLPVVLVVVLVVLYPTGTPTRLGRWVLRAFLFVAAVDAVIYAIRPGPVEGDTPPDNPLGIPGTRPVLDSATEWLGNLLAFLAVIAVIDAVQRFRRSAGAERLQFRWFLLAVAVFPVMFLAAGFLEEFVFGVVGFDPVVIVFALWGNGTAVAIGVAVTRHGLYDIDRIVSRTVSYTVVVVLLVAVYVGGVTGLTSLLPDQSRLVVAATTLAVAALFNPVRRRVQGWVDRRFNRSRYDTQRVMDRFAGSLRDQVDSEEVVDGWIGVVSETMQPAAVGVWVR
ncbi:MAG: hypothetical protein WED83_00220 [Acidimicrobiia bacterium]